MQALALIHANLVLALTHANLVLALTHANLVLTLAHDVNLRCGGTTPKHTRLRGVLRQNLSIMQRELTKHHKPLCLQVQQQMETSRYVCTVCVWCAVQYLNIT